MANGIEERDWTSLNDLMYYGRGDDRWLHIHALLTRTIGIKESIYLFERGLEELARIANNDLSIKGLTATSWIVAKYPRLLERYGFIITGEISEEMKLRYFDYENRPVYGSYMTREELLRRYLKTK